MCPIPPEPFDVSEPRFRDAFRDVVSLPKFRALRDQEHIDPCLVDTMAFIYVYLDVTRHDPIQ